MKTKISSLTLARRLPLLWRTLRLFPEMGVTKLAQLNELMDLELGAKEALARWVPYGSNLVRAIPPKSIYLIGSHNLAISTWQSIARGLILGANIHVKIPSTQATPIRDFIRALPPELRSLVSCSARPSLIKLQAAEVVIALGRDETLAEIRPQLRWPQKFLGYGSRASLLWFNKRQRFEAELLHKIADDLCAYDQLGCLSPQAIYLEKGSNVKSFCAALGRVLDQHPAPPRRPIERLQIATTIREARLSAGQAVCWTPSDGGVEWTIFQHRFPGFHPSAGFRMIQVYETTEKEIVSALRTIRGKLSTVGLAGPLSPTLERIFMELGATRFCPVGSCQLPSPYWHHDGRPQLGDMVTWVDWERG